MIEEIIKKKEDNMPNKRKARKESVANFLQVKLDTYKGWTTFQKLQFYYKNLSIFLAVIIIS